MKMCKLLLYDVDLNDSPEITDYIRYYTVQSENHGNNAVKD